MKKKTLQDKIYKFLGKTFAIILFSIPFSIMFAYGILHATTLNQEEKMKKDGKKHLFKPSKKEQKYIDLINMIRRANGQEQIARISELENSK